MDIEKILTEGIVFKGSKPSTAKKEDKVKTKAKKSKLPILGYPLLDGRQSAPV